MAELKELIEKAYNAGYSFADMVFGPLKEEPDDGEPRPKFSDLSPEDQADICSDTRMAIIAKVCPDNPAQKLRAERGNLDFSDPKVKFLDQLYTLKRTFIFKHNQPSKNITPNTLIEIQQQYKYFKECDDQFNNEDERSQYFETIDRWIWQIVEIRKTWLKFEEDLEKIRKVSMEELIKEMSPQWFEEFTGMPWKQFLEDEAPGWPTDWANGPDVVEKQRIPNGGIRLVEDWEKETADVYRDLDAARGNGVSRFKSGLAHAHQTKVMAPNGKRCKTVKVGMVPHSPFPKLHEHGHESYDGDLFPMNQMISRLDGHRSAPGWKAATVQVKRIGHDDAESHKVQVG